jgi:hypothetical protein
MTGAVHISWGDLGFLGAVISAAAALIGAVIGGGLTYAAAMHQYKLQYTDKRRDALRAILVEICENQSCLALDRALPAWLARSYADPIHERKLKEIISQTTYYSTRVYDRLFAELIASRYGPELKAYYNNLESLNKASREPKQFDVICNGGRPWKQNLN